MCMHVREWMHVEMVLVSNSQRRCETAANRLMEVRRKSLVPFDALRGIPGYPFQYIRRHLWHR